MFPNQIGLADRRSLQFGYTRRTGSGKSRDGAVRAAAFLQTVDIQMNSLHPSNVSKSNEQVKAVSSALCCSAVGARVVNSCFWASRWWFYFPMCSVYQLNCKSVMR